MKDRVVAARAFGARGGHTGLIGAVEAQRVDEAVTVVVGQIHGLAIGDLAVRFGQPDVTLGAQALAVLVIDDLVGLQGRAAIIDLHAADRGYPMIGVVVVNLARLHEHLLLPGFVTVEIDRLLDWGRGCRKGQPLRGSRRKRAHAAASQNGEDGNNFGGASGLEP